MARVYVSTVVNARNDRVWARVRDFNGLPNWHPAIAESRIEGGEPADKIGCVRDFRLRNGDRIREKLLGLSDYDMFSTPIGDRLFSNGPPSSTVHPSARTNWSAISGPACFRAALMRSSAPSEVSVPHIVKSTILDAPTGAVWNVLRDFNGHDRWHPAVATSTIERAQ